LAKLQRYIII